jgi:hypothetical protein
MRGRGGSFHRLGLACRAGGLGSAVAVSARRDFVLTPLCGVTMPAGPAAQGSKAWCNVFVLRDAVC